MKKRLNIEAPGGVKQVLLHTCCAPCSSAIIECMMQNGIMPLVFYCNPKTLEVGYEDIEADIFNIYPNPVEKQLVISSEENIETISIYNLNGVMVYSGTYNAEGVDVMNLNAGVYFINIKTESYDVTRRIVKK